MNGKVLHLISRLREAKIALVSAQNDLDNYQAPETLENYDYGGPWEFRQGGKYIDYILDAAGNNLLFPSGCLDDDEPRKARIMSLAAESPAMLEVLLDFEEWVKKRKFVSRDIQEKIKPILARLRGQSGE